jgi:hypothetical protein
MREARPIAIPHCQKQGKGLAVGASNDGSMGSWILIQDDFPVWMHLQA